MKLKSLLWTLGARPSARKYGSQRIRFQLEKDGLIEFDKWLHPKDGFEPFDQSYLDTIRQFVKPGDAVLDIGAHCGDFTLPLALAAGPTGVVFAWEPNPYVFEILQKNAQLNPDRTRIIPVCAAVAPQDGELTFHYSDPGFNNGGNLAGVSRWTHGHAFKLKVKALNFENWVRDHYPEYVFLPHAGSEQTGTTGMAARVQFIKCDTEGFDFQILKSLERTIRASRPYIHVEYFRHVSIEGRKELWNYLNQLGYEQFTTDGKYGVQPIDKVLENDVNRWEHFDVIALPS